MGPGMMGPYGRGPMMGPGMMGPGLMRPYGRGPMMHGGYGFGWGRGFGMFGGPFGWFGGFGLGWFGRGIMRGYMPTKTPNIENNVASKTGYKVPETRKVPNYGLLDKIRAWFHLRGKW